MRSFAATFARNGYVAVTFDFAGHARNPAPLTGSITDAEGATRTLRRRNRSDRRLRPPARRRPPRRARPLHGLGHRRALLGSDPRRRGDHRRLDVLAGGDRHRAAQPPGHRRRLGRHAEARGAAGRRPRDRPGARRARRHLRRPGQRHRAAGRVQPARRARRRALQPRQPAGGRRLARPVVRDRPARRTGRSRGRGRGSSSCSPASCWLARPLSRLLPRIATPPAGAGLGWRRMWIPLLVPMVATPLVLRVLPTHFLPVLVGDYLAAHFALYGLITAACLALARGFRWPVRAGGDRRGSRDDGGGDRLRVRRPGLADQRLRHVVPAGAASAWS